MKGARGAKGAGCERCGVRGAFLPLPASPSRRCRSSSPAFHFRPGNVALLAEQIELLAQGIHSFQMFLAAKALHSPPSPSIQGHLKELAKRTTGEKTQQTRMRPVGVTSRKDAKWRPRANLGL